MTQEKKAKAYDEALKTVTQWIKDGCSDKEKICLESIFPQLRESEDERIRKEIIDFIQWAEDRGMTRHDYHQAKRPAVWIAYLEKQKETANSFTDGVIEVRSFQRGIAEGRRLERQKECVADSSKTSVDEDESIRKFLVDYFTSYKIGNVATKLNGVRIDDILNYLEKQKKQKSAQTVDEKEYIRTLKGLVSDFIRNSGGGITDVEYYQNICDWLDGRHIEQKPAEWDDYTKTNLGRAIQIIKDARGTLHGYQTDDGIYECDKAIEALEHFLYRGLEIEKSAEWSEEDKAIISCIVCCLDGQFVTEAARKQCLEWFNKHRRDFLNQPKQEWSEEDEIYLQDALWCVEKAEKSCKDEQDKGACWSAKRWLKSLRPVSKESLQSHWKPSEEQMEVDLNAEIEKELRLHYNDDQDVYWWNYLKNSFRHFYELGKNSK